MLNGFIEVLKMFWTIDEFKSAIIGIPVSIITFRIVGGFLDMVEPMEYGLEA